MRKLFETERWVAHVYGGCIAIMDKTQPLYVSPEQRREELVARIEELRNAPQSARNQFELARARSSLAELDDDSTPVSPDLVAQAFEQMLQLPEGDVVLRGPGDPRLRKRS